MGFKIVCQEEMKNTPLITVLIANYNNGKFLREALDSVFAQSYPNWAVTIVDDCSTDESESIYLELDEDKRFRVIRNEENKGVAFTRKRLVEETDCELMCFLDPDDALTPNALQDHVDVHLRHPEVSIVFSRRYLCDKDLNIQDESRVLRIPEGKTYFTLKDFREEHLVSFKKSYYNKTEGMNPDYRLAEDTYMNVMMEEVGQVYCLDKICYKYRRNGNSLTRDYGRHMFWNMLVQYDTCKRRGIDAEEQIYPWFEGMIDYVAKERIQKAELVVRQSAAYRLGSALLRPLKCLQRMLNK